MTTDSIERPIRLIDFSTAVVLGPIQMVMLLIGRQRYWEKIQTPVVSEFAANRLSETTNSEPIEN